MLSARYWGEWIKKVGTEQYLHFFFFLLLFPFLLSNLTDFFFFQFPFFCLLPFFPFHFLVFSLSIRLSLSLLLKPSPTLQLLVGKERLRFGGYSVSWWAVWPVKAIILPESMFPPLEWVIRGVIVGIWSHSVVPHPNCWGVVTISGPLGPFSKPSSTVVPHEEKASKSEISHA